MDRRKTLLIYLTKALLQTLIPWVAGYNLLSAPGRSVWLCGSGTICFYILVPVHPKLTQSKNLLDFLPPLLQSSVPTQTPVMRNNLQEVVLCLQNITSQVMLCQKHFSTTHHLFLPIFLLLLVTVKFAIWLITSSRKERQVIRQIEWSSSKDF